MSIVSLKFDSNKTFRWRQVKVFQNQIEEPEIMIKHKTREFMKTVQEFLLRYEFKELICAERYELSNVRKDSRNGYRYRGLNTGFGYIKDIKVPRGRKGGYSFSLFKRYKRRSEEFDNIVLYAVLCGMSNRRVRQFFATFYQSKLSESTISNVVAQLDEELKAFRSFPIALNYPYLIVDDLQVSILSGGIEELNLSVALEIKRAAKDIFMA